MDNKKALLDYVLHLADNALVLGQRLSEWCGHGPELEVDIGLTNIALDHIGHSRMLYQYAAEIEGRDKTEDSYAFLRTDRDFKNVLLVEQPNEDFAYTIVRSFFYDVYNKMFFTKLLSSTDKQLAAIAEKAIKELHYHLRYSAEWVIRLGDGTDVSHQKMLDAVEDLWFYMGELFTPADREAVLVAEGVIPNVADLEEAYMQQVKSIFEQATLPVLEGEYWQLGGKSGIHTEHLGPLLAEMQYMQRAYPNMEW